MVIHVAHVVHYLRHKTSCRQDGSQPALTHIDVADDKYAAFVRNVDLPSRVTHVRCLYARGS
jgi:hypothetical protein